MQEQSDSYAAMRAKAKQEQLAGKKICAHNSRFQIEIDGVDQSAPHQVASAIARGAVRGCGSVFCVDPRVIQRGAHRHIGGVELQKGQDSCYQSDRGAIPA